MGLKAQKKFAELHEAYEMARSVREHSAVAARSSSLEEAAAMLLADDGVNRAEAHLAALSHERKALKRIVKYARKHGDKISPEKALPPKLVSRKRQKADEAAA